VLPASQRTADETWYQGTADAVYQNLDILRSYQPEYVLVLADGVARFGRTGPSGWIHEHRAPAGEYTVLDPLLFESER
jgi:ADP-glucose pyrophosphorylase